jgi:hypothetical protein
MQHVLVDEAHPAMADDERCLATLEPRLDLSMLFLTLVTATGRLAVAGRGTATSPDALVVGALVVGKTGEDRCASCLHREGGKERDQAGWPGRGLNCRSAAPRRLRER